ncbi:DUF2163 domain-containing protein [Roseisalinus antarcticus]|uniref:Bacteriophage phiJL001 Gp84 C-terminal domain-containing protein n=1 Tax=Roseisalinus antarcticus TaxID=254357 RepID=A0A1Y5T7W2_9RHOB|nr:DUF2163 domain-containing protein [Roseisalinus antarcticus]SLN54460.1 hypothetical protein ROA7023_02439 [Roseisalinus antarcticus]
MTEALNAHLRTGLTNVCRCWRITRRDGTRLGFTDHDRDLAFDGTTFRADTGMTARALVQSTGLSVDNSEALGILSDSAVTEADIEAGRYDGAEVRAWLVNWRDVTQRSLRFRGQLGDITRGGGAFHAELRGLTEALNLAVGRSYQPVCDAVLGDRSCKVDLDQPGFSAEVAVTVVTDNRRFRFVDPSGAAPRWFERGRLIVTSGAAEGLTGVIREDQMRPEGERAVYLWEALRAPVEVGDTIRIEAGCDKRAATCKAKFANLINFRGFPHIPGEDWLTSVPRSSDSNTGGKRP